MKRVAEDRLHASGLAPKSYANLGFHGLQSVPADEFGFVDAIHRAFPYADRQLAAELTQQSLRISVNSAFMVLHEVVFPSEPGMRWSPGQQAALQVLDSKLRHPLKGVLLPLARPLITGERLEQQAALVLLRRIEPFHGQYNALAIGYRAHDGLKPEVGRLYTSILGRWQRQRWLD